MLKCQFQQAQKRIIFFQNHKNTQSPSTDHEQNRNGTLNCMFMYVADKVIDFSILFYSIIIIFKYT